MLAAIVVKELRSHLLTARFQVILLLQVVGLAAGLGVTTERLLDRQQTYHASRALSRRENADALIVMNQTEEYERHDFQGIYAAREPADWSWAVRGVDEWLPAQVHVSQEHNRSVDGAVYRNPLTARFPAPDLLYLTLFLLSLLAVVLIFDGIAAEREHGTLQLVLTQAVPRHLLLLGKWLASFCALATGSLLGVGIASLHAILTGAATLSSDWALIALLLLLGVLLYVAVFLALGLLVSVLARESSTALVVSLLAWAAVNLVLPALLGQSGILLAPSPSSARLQSDLHGIDHDTQVAIRALPRDENRQDAVLRLREQAGERKTAAQVDHDRRLRRQADVTRAVWRGTPAGALANGLTAAAGTSVEWLFDYRDARRRLGKSFKDLVEQQDRLAFDPGDLSHLPVDAQTFGRRLQSAAVDYLVLVVYAVGLLLAAHACFLRRDVT